MAKEPILVVFDIDGTLAQLGPRANESEWTNDYLFGLPAYANMLGMVRDYLKKRNATVMFCTGRPVRWRSVTRRWLNSKLNLSQSNQRVTVTCRPDDIPETRIPAFKLAAILQAIRRLGSNPAEAILFDDDVQNLRLYETLRPMVRKLTVYKADEGMVSEWSL